MQNLQIEGLNDSVPSNQNTEFNPALTRGYVFDPIRKWADESPSKVAILSEDIRLTYSELEFKTNQIAHCLQSLGVQHGDRVAFTLPRGPQAIILLISILKSGAIYVPIDSESPQTRLRECLEDAQPSLVVTASGPRSLGSESAASIISIDDLFKSSESFSTEALSKKLFRPTDLAYIIFTSGTTGRPKGVPISHISLTNFVAGDQEICIRVAPEDHVFQGFSPASDGHHEEVWPTFRAGATLVVAKSKEVHSGIELHTFLNQFKVTIISCAPTLLSMVDGDVPSIRRILFGAESCPPSLVQRWWRPGREILNTYGPTEATVGTTFSYCLPDQPITIGKPLPNYYCYVIDENLNLTEGEGELAIAGISVSSGYYGRGDSTATRFVPNPFAKEGLYNETLYRTGDRVRRDADGNLVWLGRIDGQIKIRGHRIELSEVETHVLAHPAIQSGVVVAREGVNQELRLDALVVLKQDLPFDVADFVSQLRLVLPSYMVPQQFEEVDQIPMLPSGKVDRRSCLTLHGRSIRIEREILLPQTETEQKIMTIWEGLFPGVEISCADDFFRDLGGYSLLASRFVSTLRGDLGYVNVSVLEIYENPTIRSFAAILDSQTKSVHEDIAYSVVPKSRYVKAKIVQGIGVLALFGVQGLFWIGPIIAAIYFSNNGVGEFPSLLLGFVIHAVSVPLLLLLAIITKWVVVGRFKPGKYPMWGGMFLRWWFVHRMMALAPVSFLTGSPLAAIYMRLMGAKVGKNVCFESLEVDCPDLIEIGDDCSFENSSWIHTSDVAHGELRLEKVKIGNGVTVGVRSGVCAGAVIEAGASLRDLTCIGPGVTVPAGEEWMGSPGRKAPYQVMPAYDASRQPSASRLLLYTIGQTGLIGLLAFLDSIPFFAVTFAFYNISVGPHFYLIEPLYAVAVVLLSCVQALVVKWVVAGRLKPGNYSFPGFYWLRQWFAEKHLELLTSMIVPVYDSLLARPWCVLLGMKCGPRCEIALPRRMPYDLVEMGEESFLASEVSIGRPIRRNGVISFARTSIGKRTFIGNDSVVPQGTHVPDEFLLGVLSVSPRTEDIGTDPDQTWLGSPPFRMPNRQIYEQFDLKQTYRPTKRMYIERLLHEIIRIVLPSMCFMIMVLLTVEAFVEVWNNTSLLGAFLTKPLLYTGAAIIGAVMCLIAKKLLVGKYTPTVQPLWSRFVWKAESYSAVLHDFGVPLFILSIVGTPFLNGLMRFLGAKVGKRAFINSTDWTETDLIQVGEDAAINANAPLQAHLFEDRVMKIGPIKIGERSTVGNYSVVLCDSEVKSDAHVGHLSLVMKGETIPSHTFWAGSPAMSVKEPRPVE